MKSIQLIFCRVEIHAERRYLETIFADGARIGAYPHETADYRAVTAETGYGDDIWAYARDHELLHNLLPQEVNGTPSHVLWHLAHETKADPWKVWQEESLAISFQRFLTGRDKTMPATAPGVDRYRLKAMALDLLSWEARKEAA